MNIGMHLFLTIWIGEFVSNIGTGMTTFGLLIYVYKLTDTTMSVSLVLSNFGLDAILVLDIMSSLLLSFYSMKKKS